MDQLLFVLLLFGLPIGLLWWWSSRASAKRRRLIGRVTEVVQQNLDALARQRMQKVYKDAYGTVRFEKWLKELRYFRDTLLVDRIQEFSSSEIQSTFDRTLDQFDEMIMEREYSLTGGFDFHDHMNPVDYERLCAALLERSGWSARLTPGSGDQGADVIAAKNGVTVVLQCKLYRSPVGNKAVQEISAARTHFGARHAIVVTNRTFTPSAQQLAKSTRTLLIHHTQLTELDQLIAAA